jgi:quercetin dioxygenase-like cupin family protein
MITHKDGIPVVDGDAPIPVGAIEVSDDDHGLTGAGGYVIKWLRLKPGEMCLQHVHPHAHCTLVLDGEVEVMQDYEVIGRFGPMQAVNIAAGKPHQIRAITPARFACIHYLPDEVH